MQIILLTIDNDNHCALLREPIRGGLTDPRRGSGDDDNLVLESLHCFRPLEDRSGLNADRPEGRRKDRAASFKKLGVQRR